MSDLKTAVNIPREGGIYVNVVNAIEGYEVEFFVEGDGNLVRCVVYDTHIKQVLRRLDFDPRQTLTD